jgi:hypothetical protein
VLFEQSTVKDVDASTADVIPAAILPKFKSEVLMEQKGRTCIVESKLEESSAAHAPFVRVSPVRPRASARGISLVVFFIRSP